MTKELRFFQKEYQNRATPGPGDYKNVTNHVSPKGNIGIVGSQTFSRDMRGDIKVYNHEYEKDFLNKTGPGPGKYDNHISFKRMLQNVRPSFPKVK